ncbi:MAG: signal peptidase II [Coraliomargarita sp.]
METTTGKLRAYKRLYVVAVLVFALDQITKWWIFNHLTMNRDRITVVEDFFYIVHVGNEGAAWGMFSGYGGVLTLFAAIALLAIYFFRHSLQLKLLPIQLFFGMMIGGIIGNAIDRMVHGHVVDFLDFHFPFEIPVVLPNGHYPTFNVADCGIVVGVFGYIAYSFTLPPPPMPQENSH